MNRYKAKHMNTRQGFIKTKGKHVIESNKSYKSFSMALVLLLLISVSSTTAYLMLKNSKTNEFVLGEVAPEIIEAFSAENKTKEDVCIKNSGNVPIFVRTAVIIEWKDNNNRILTTIPVQDVDYSISFSSSNNWIKSDDGFYYYKNPIDINENTDVLIEECTQLIEYENKVLEVDIITQGIQAEPSRAVEEAWNVNIVNNCISLGG